MTTLFIEKWEDSNFGSGLCEAVAKILPTGCALVHGRQAEVLLALSVPQKASKNGGRVWMLTWEDGTPLNHTAPLAQATCKASSRIGIRLAEECGGNWSVISQAAFTAEPGNWPATCHRTCNYAAMLVASALKNKNSGIKGEPFLIRQPHRNILPFAFKLQCLWRYVRHKAVQIAFYEHWRIAIVNSPVEASPDWLSCPEPQWLEPVDAGFYLADPFAWPKEPQTVLCEEYDLAARRGYIVQLTLDKTDIISKTPVKLPLVGHMSFPFLFRHEGEVYCLPESGAARRLIICKWEQEGFTEYSTVLENVAAADAILFSHAGCLWIAYTDTAINAGGNLNLCYASSLKGPWQAHAGNPVKVDPQSSRNAGNVFMHQGRLIRPAQDCVKTYGAAIRLMHITKCTPEAFCEEEINVIYPPAGPNRHGIHTLSAYGDKCLIDGKRRIFSLSMIVKKALRRLGRNVRS